MINSDNTDIVEAFLSTLDNEQEFFNEFKTIDESTNGNLFQILS